MATTRSERVENALQSLLERLVPPQQPGEDEDTADQRWEDANNLATDIIDRGENDAVRSEDVNHVADLIRRSLINEHGDPGHLSRFGNLYSRLLAQPVLAKKWGILYFLLKVSEGRDQQNGDSEEDEGETDGEGIDEEQNNGLDADGYGQQNETLDEAFARNGLRRTSVAQGPESARHTPIRDRDKPLPPRPQPKSPEEIPRSAKKLTTGLEPSESALLRDLPFTLQGLSSTNLLFADKRSLKLPTTLPVPIVSLLHTLAEPSLLYRSLAEFVESAEGGLVGQALRSAIGIELRSYLSLVATLEGQIRRALAQLDETTPGNGLGKAGVTLKRCIVWTRDATLGLRLMSTMVESAKGKKGGELISLIHTFASSHGDPFVHTFAERLLTQVTRPFYAMLRAWIYEGELEDPYLEFFVYENLDNDDVGATSMWETKYRLKESMIPSIMTSDFANRVFLIGKSLNFIRYGCADSGWVEAYSKSASRELKYGDTAVLSSSIDEAYKTVMDRLLSLMENKFALFSHLKALKGYLLLGQGDFVSLLMESLSSNLDRPANSQYRHTLTAQLEHAIRNSNAQYDSQDVLRRLDARMLELSHGEIGWDVFTLEYRVDSPLDVIVSPWANKQYLKVFNFLWRVKRVEFALSTTWRRLQTGSRGVLGAVTEKLGTDWKNARVGLAEMVHFIDQLQYYILFEVIEAGWAKLETEIRKPDATLDTLIQAHTEYLLNITRKGLLGTGGVLDFTAQLHELLKLMLAYKDAVDSLYSYSVAESTRRQDLAARIETRTRAGRWGLTEADDDASSPAQQSLSLNHNASPLPQLIPLQQQQGASGADSGEHKMLDQLRQRLRSLPVDFKARMNVLLGDLGMQQDQDVRFLGIVMNFNDVYAPVKRRTRKPDKDKVPVAVAVAVAAKRGPG